MPGRTRTAGPTGRARTFASFPITSRLTRAAFPIPPPVGAAPPSKATLAELEQRIAVMNDERTVRNLQASYGYYVNRRMWDDVTDLFADERRVRGRRRRCLRRPGGRAQGAGAHGACGADARRAQRSPAIRHRGDASPPEGAKPMSAASSWACWARPTRARRYLGSLCVRQPLREGRRHLEGARDARVPAVPLRIQQGWGKSRIVEKPGRRAGTRQSLPALMLGPGPRHSRLCRRIRSPASQSAPEG